MSRRPIEPNAENCTLAELETAMKAAPRKTSYRRLFAIRLMLMGYRPAEVARMHGVSRSTTLSWVKRFNERGIDGLLDAPRARTALLAALLA